MHGHYLPLGELGYILKFYFEFRNITYPLPPPLPPFSCDMYQRNPAALHFDVSSLQNSKLFAHWARTVISRSYYYNHSSATSLDSGSIHTGALMVPNKSPLFVIRSDWVCGHPWQFVITYGTSPTFILPECVCCRFVSHFGHEVLAITWYCVTVELNG